MPLPAPSPEGTCLVTGASSGIGAEIARCLARRGRGVFLVARREGRLTALADELTAAHGVRAEVAALDLTDAAARADLVAEIAARGLRVDVLVNDAGMAPAGRVDRRDADEEVHVVRLNVEAAVDLTTRLTPAMVQRGAGGVLTLASIAAFAPNPNQATYGASKAFLLSYSDAIGAELRPLGVHVTALCPGPVPTEIFRGSRTHPVDRAPRLFWRAAPPVAEAGVRALERDRPRAFEGAPNRAAAQVARLMPRWRPGLEAFARVFTAPDEPNPARR